MMAMQRVQPELKRLQAKYKNDRQKLNEEMMKFYKENQINPLAGCLPLLLQLPLFIVLYRVIAGLSHTPWPKYIKRSTELAQALHDAGGKMVSWGIDLSKTAAEKHSSFGVALPYYILVALVVATGYYQQRQMTARNPQAAANPQAQMMGKVFPIVFGFISLNIQAAVVIYFVVSNIWQIAQQAVIFRHQPAVAGGGASGPLGKPKDAPKNGRDGKRAPPPKTNQSQPPHKPAGGEK